MVPVSFKDHSFMKSAFIQIVIGALMLASIFASACEYPPDNFFKNIPACLFFATGFYLAAKVFQVVKRLLSKRFKFHPALKVVGIILLILAAYLYWIVLALTASRLGL